MDLSKLIEKKADAAKYMVKEITYIIQNCGTRAPGTEGEKKACEYMADVLRNDCGCDRVEVESFKENPGSFLGWIYFTVTMMLAAIVLYFFFPLASVLLIILGLTLMVLQFGLYKKAVDKFFPEMTGHNVTAFKSCKGEIKRRIIFNGHPDASWEWPVNYHLGGTAFHLHAIIGVGGAIYYLIMSIIQLIVKGIGFDVLNSGWLFICGLVGLIFVPFLATLYYMWNKNRIVDGANDNLSGCYMGIALLKALKDEGIEFENTELGVVLTGSEEAGLRGAMAWSEAHKGEFDDVPTFIYSYDTIHDPKYLMVNYRDLNATVKADKDVSDLFMECAEELGVQCSKGMVPPLGGATDNAAFAKIGGMRSTGITGLNHSLEDYYHTRRDTYDNMNEQGLADCYAVTVMVLEKFDEGAKQ